LIIAKGRSRPRQQQKDTSKKLRVNDQIRISPVRLVDQDNEQVGIVETDDAKQRAREAGLDLVEVAPNSQPPVCRIMDYGKWKYAQRKKEQKAKSHAKQAEIKGVRLRPKIDDHDLNTKLKKARDFLSDGNKVQFTMLFRGREMAHRDLGQEQMEGISEDLEDIAKVEQPPKMMGRRMTMLLTPDRKQKNPDKQAKSGEDQSNGEAEAD
jgi:translation initiation factor IF-3